MKVSINKEKHIEINEWIKKAEVTWDDARILIGGDKREGPVSRIYYSARHCATAVLLLYDVRCRSHSATISEFGRIVVKQKKFPKRYGKFLNEMFKFRTKADYFVAPPRLFPTRIKKYLKTANNFIDCTCRFINKNSVCT